MVVPGVSQNINVFYLNACPVNSVIEMEVYTASVGKTIALIAADFWLVERAMVRKTTVKVPSTPASGSASRRPLAARTPR